MDFESHPSSLRCEVRIMKLANNINIKSRGVLFVRCYVSAGNRSKVRIESQEFPSKSDTININQTFSLDCLGTSSSIQCLKQESHLLVELRWRSKAAPFISRIMGSRLMGRAQVPWKQVLDSTNMEIEKWVPQNLRVYNDDVIQPIALQIGLRVHHQDFERKKICEERWDERCGCNSCSDYEFFAIQAALEAL